MEENQSCKRQREATLADPKRGCMAFAIEKGHSEDEQERPHGAETDPRNSNGIEACLWGRRGRGAEFGAESFGSGDISGDIEDISGDDISDENVPGEIHGKVKKKVVSPPTQWLEENRREGVCVST